MFDIHSVYCSGQAEFNTSGAAGLKSGQWRCSYETTDKFNVIFRLKLMVVGVASSYDYRCWPD